MSSILPPPSQAGSSSSNTLYAQPSREWKIPPKPKPGRKPKNQSLAPVQDIELNDEARKNQNRAAQRAFRERKQDQLATLQARLQSYEQGETERHVQLQALGKRLKEENDELRKENTTLKEEIARLKAERTARSESIEPRVKLEGIEVDLSVPVRKRTPSLTPSSIASRKRQRRDNATCIPSMIISHTVQPSQVILSVQSPRVSDAPSSGISPKVLHDMGGPSNSFSYTTSLSTLSTSAGTPSSTYASTPSSSSIVSSPASMQSPQATTSLGNDIRMRVLDSDATISAPTKPVDASASYRQRAQATLNRTSSIFEPSRHMEIVDCGFCSEDTPCICREIAMRERQSAQEHDSVAAILSEEYIIDSPAESIDRAPIATPSILDNLPPYQPPVPLRKRKINPEPSSSSTFPMHSRLPSLSSLTLTQSSSGSTSGPSCTGDPSNCGACKDDPFGRAFCSALNSACVEGKCSKCPGRSRSLVEIEPASKSRGEGPKLSCCGDVRTCSGSGCGVMSRPTMQPAPAPPKFSTIPTSSAWATLKAHPAIQHKSHPFTKLDILADVVARRTKCTGPRVIIEPALGSLTPERVASPSGSKEDQATVALGVACSHDRVKEVVTEGVNDALALLDDHLRQTEMDSED